MGFQCVASGYLLGKHDIIGLVRLLCKSITCDGDEGDDYDLYDSDTDIDPTIFQKDDFENLFIGGIFDHYGWEDFIGIMSDKYTAIELYDDIVFDSKKRLFFYKHDPNIKIGEPHACIQMIYVSLIDQCYGTGTEIPDFTLINLVNWKKELVKQRRMKDVKFSMAMNCCS